MSDVVHAITTYMKQNPEHGMMLAFALGYIESLPLVGTALPSMLTIPPLGLMISHSALPPLATPIMLFMGVFLGDLTCFMLGKRYRIPAQAFLVRSIGTDNVQSIAKRVQTVGGLSLILAKFAGPMRGFFCIASGTLGLGTKQFVLFSVPGISLWCAIHLMPGVLLHTPVLATAYLARLQLPILTTHTLGYLAILVVCTALTPIASRAVNRCANLQAMTSQATYRMLTLIMHGTPLYMLHAMMDRAEIKIVNQIVHSSLTNPLPIAHSIASLLSECSDPKSLLLITLVQALVLARMRSIHVAQRLAAPIVVAFSLGALLKYILRVARPEEVGKLLGYYNSFPSGHTLMVCIVVWTWARLLDRSVQRFPPSKLRMLSNTFILTIMWSRLCLGAHWCTDIIGGWLLALGVHRYDTTTNSNACNDGEYHALCYVAKRSSLLYLLAFIFYTLYYIHMMHHK